VQFNSLMMSDLWLE